MEVVVSLGSYACVEVVSTLAVEVVVSLGSLLVYCGGGGCCFSR